MENIFTQAFIALILSASAVALPVTQMLKRLLKIEGIYAVALSLVVSALTGLVMGLANSLSGIQIAIFIIAIFGEINGFYKVVKRKKKTGGING